MTEFAIMPPKQASVAVANNELRYPVRRIYCVGRNYAAHAIEMGKDPERDPPFFFTKPADAVVDDRQSIPYPPQTANLHYEAELVVAIARTTRNVSVDNALDYVWGYAVGNDLTRRDLQLEAREKGRPWDTGKAFDQSAICGPVHPVSDVGHLASGLIELRVNGEVKQSADLKELIWNVPEIISILSGLYTLEAGDLIMTGTPAGVGPLTVGDVCQVGIEGLGKITTIIGPARPSEA